MRLLTWLDWFDVARMVSIEDPEASIIAPSLTREMLHEAVHCVAKDGRIHRGARCIRFIGMRMPLLLPLSLVLWIPGIIYIAEWVYKLISRNRHLLSKLFGCKGACEVMPTRKGHGKTIVKPEETAINDGFDK